MQKETPKFIWARSADGDTLGWLLGDAGWYPVLTLDTPSGFWCSGFHYCPKLRGDDLGVGELDFSDLSHPDADSAPVWRIIEHILENWERLDDLNRGESWTWDYQVAYVDAGDMALYHETLEQDGQIFSPAQAESLRGAAGNDEEYRILWHRLAAENYIEYADEQGRWRRQLVESARHDLKRITRSEEYYRQKASKAQRLYRKLRKSAPGKARTGRVGTKARLYYHWLAETRAERRESEQVIRDYS